MIVFDYQKYLKDIRKNGIQATDIHASAKISDLLSDLIYNSSYKKGKIIKMVSESASDYFRGVPEDIVVSEIADNYDSIKNSGLDRTKKEKKILKLYESEMAIISALDDEKLQRLAFGCLVAFKFHSCHRVFDKVEYHRYVADCLNDAFALANFGSVSGAIRNKLTHELIQRGLLYYYPNTNPTYKYQQFNKKSNKKRWLAFNIMSVPFCVEVKQTQDEETVFIEMRNYDDVLLYLRYYLGDEKVTTCEGCGTPILKSGNAKRYCSDCAEQMKKQNDKERYQASKVV